MIIRTLNAIGTGIGRIWLLRIFEAEFGYSDLLSNYSRTYAWMANQLGHMTLGLVTALTLMWIAVTFSDKDSLLTGQTLVIVGVVGAAAALTAIFQTFRSAGLTLLLCAILMAWVQFDPVLPSFGEPRQTVFKSLIAGSVVLGTFGLLILIFKNLGIQIKSYMARRRSTHANTTSSSVKADLESDLKSLTSICSFPETWGFSLIATLAVLLVAYAFAEPALRTGGLDGNRLFGIVLTLSMAALAVVFLCKDGRFSIIGVTSIFVAGAFILAKDTIATQVLAAWLPGTAPLYLYLAIPIATLIAFFTRDPDQRTALIVLTVLALIAAGSVWHAFHTPPSDETMVAIGFATASLAIWFAKEFGSDMPRVRDEILRARQRRREHGIHDINKVMERRYAYHGIMDTRTDAAFYFAGAFIAVGLPIDPGLVSSPVGSITAAGWSTEIEIVGTLVFIMMFLAIGRNWAFRQEAVDLTGSYRANRMALFWGQAHRDGQTKPLDMYSLQVFARGKNKSGTSPDGEPLAPQPEMEWLPDSIEHLIIPGKAGGGRTPLGAALATEAALEDIPTDLLEAPKPRREDDQTATSTDYRRTARYLKMSTLRWTHNGTRARSELLYTPTRDFYFCAPKRAGEPTARRSIGISQGKGSLALGHASFVVLDDCSGSEHDFLTVCNRLSLHPTANGVSSGQSTVWLVAADEDARASVGSPGPPTTDSTNDSGSGGSSGPSGPDGSASDRKDASQVVKSIKLALQKHDVPAERIAVITLTDFRPNDTAAG